VNTEGAGPWQGRWNRDLDAARPRTALPAPAIRGEVTRHYDSGSASGDAGEGELGLRVGVKVRHKQFGTGEVRAWQSSGADLKITVRFASVGTKTVLARFLSRP
jgi:hypothetical protein